MEKSLEIVTINTIRAGKLLKELPLQLPLEKVLGEEPDKAVSSSEEILDDAALSQFQMVRLCGILQTVERRAPHQCFVKMER